MISYRRRRLWLSSCKRALRWEFWPMWLFYIPVVLYIICLSFRYRRLSFTAVNPGMYGSGFVGESKSEPLLELQKTVPDSTAKTFVIDCKLPLPKQVQQCEDIIKQQQFTYPVVLKPDSGQRGIDVAIIKDQQALVDYLTRARFDTLLQPYIAGVEFGIFYYRYPDAKQGDVFSLTHKCFPHVIGDGVTTLEKLILSHSRLHMMARFLLHQHKSQIERVPTKGEIVNVVKLGSHCRGSLFLDGYSYLTPQVTQTIDTASQQLSGFYFGRYDVRAESIEAFQRGEFKIIEVNGVTSESTNIYDPKNGLLTAYNILFKQWRLAFAIGEQNYRRGHKTLSLRELLATTQQMNRETKRSEMAQVIS